MKYSKNLFLLSSLFALSAGAWAEDEKVLVAYFSWSSSHNTRTMAEYIAEETGGKLFEIKPAVPYTTSYNQVLDVARKELAEKARRHDFYRVSHLVVRRPHDYLFFSGIPQFCRKENHTLCHFRRKRFERRRKIPQPYRHGGCRRSLHQEYPFFQCPETNPRLAFRSVQVNQKQPAD